MKKTTKILVSALLTLCMLLPMATMVFATTTTNEVANSKYTGSTESATEYYQGLIDSSATQFDVYSADALVALVELINADANGFAGKTVSLKCDLIFNEGKAGDWAANPPANSWTPIANFKGTFNGEGHTVSGLYMNTESEEVIYSGFFGCLKDGAKVYNLGVVNSYIKNSYTTSNTTSTNEDLSGMAGSIAGAINGKNVEISGCYSDAILSAVYTTGGIVGIVENTIAQAELTANTTSFEDLANNTAALISQCAFDGKVHTTTEGTTSTQGASGGIVGTIGTKGRTANDHDAAKIEDCVNFGDVSTKYAGNIQAIGGILGFLDCGANGTTTYGKAIIERCLNFGSCTTEGAGTSTKYNTVEDAFVGQVRANANSDLTVIDCFIFDDLDQSFFSFTNPMKSLYFTLKIGETTYTKPQKDDVLPYVADAEIKAAYTIADSNTVKTTLPDGYTNWTTRTKNAENDYPLPTAVYDNFFKVELKYVQSTNVDNGVYDVRIIAEVDSLNYNAAGFEVIADGNKKLDVNTKTATEVKVYKTVNSISESYTAVGGRYYVTITITGISGAHTLKVTPYTYGDVADSETKVTGAAKTLTFGADGVCTNVQ